MTPTLWTTETDRIPGDATVRDYDELTGDARHALPAAANAGTAPVSLAAGEQFADLDVVKYTDYYRVAVVTREDAQGAVEDIASARGAVPEFR